MRHRRAASEVKQPRTGLRSPSAGEFRSHRAEATQRSGTNHESKSESFVFIGRHEPPIAFLFRQKRVVVWLLIAKGCMEVCHLGFVNKNEIVHVWLAGHGSILMG